MTRLNFPAELLAGANPDSLRVRITRLKDLIAHVRRSRSNVNQPLKATHNHNRRKAMNWDQVEGKWKEYKGQIKQKWNKLTDDDIGQMSGKKDELMGRLQKTYGYTQEQAEREVDEFSQSLDRH